MKAGSLSINPWRLVMASLQKFVTATGCGPNRSTINPDGFAILAGFRGEFKGPRTNLVRPERCPLPHART